MPGRGFRVPPGRAGRLWLQRRLAVARRGADLLDRKLLILRGELDGLREAARRTEADWLRCQADAERWLVRVALLGGERAVRLAAAAHPAEVTIGYRAVMGVRYPAEASCAPPAAGAGDGDGLVLAAARQAHQDALAAAVRHAAAARALALVEAEALATRHRLRAIRDRWIPRLEEALTDVTLAIEEQEIADAARLRLAAGAGSGGPGRRNWLPRGTADKGGRDG